MLTEQKNKTAKLFQLTATTSNPWDEVQFNFWMHKVTNMVLSAIRLALKDDAKTDVNKLLFSTRDHNNVAVSSGDKRNIAGLCQERFCSHYSHIIQHYPTLDDIESQLITFRLTLDNITLHHITPHHITPH